MSDDNRDQRCVSHWIAVLLLSLIVPTQYSIEVFELRLSPYRIVLILSSIQVLDRYFRRTKKSIADLWVFVASFLMLGSMLFNHGLSALPFGSSLMLETLIPYLIGRVFLNSVEALNKFISVYFISLSIIFVPVMIEFISGANLLMGTNSTQHEMRFSFYRSFGPFDHPILFGIYAAAGVGLIHVLLEKFLTKYVISISCALCSLSSAAYLMVVIQLFFLWSKKIATYKIKTYAILFVIIYIAIDLYSQRSPLAVLATYLSLDKETAYFRLLINENAIENVKQNPFLGIGLSDWNRPSWMPYSIDNFYLVLAVKHGVFATLSVLIVMLLALKSTYAISDEKIGVAFRMLLISMAIALFTVHIWNSVYVFFWIILGLSINLQYIDNRSIGKCI